MTKLTDEQLVGYAQAIELAEIAGVRVVLTHQEATALLAHADAALRAYLRQAEDGGREAARLCGTVAGEDDNRASDVM